MIDKAHQHLARAWARLDRAEALARQAARGEAEPSLWLLAVNSILRARDALEAIHPAAAETGALGALVGGDCRHLVWAAAGELASIPAGHEPAGLSVALVHLALFGRRCGSRSVQMGGDRLRKIGRGIDRDDLVPLGGHVDLVGRGLAQIQEPKVVVHLR